jgi:two-component system response regulator FlrC
MAQDERRGPILVIDDDPDVREAIVDTLEDEGYDVVQMPGGREALAYLSGNPPPALIFLDWNMAPMNAPQFMDEFCKEPLLRRTPVVLVTADVHASKKATTSRYDGFITKPIDLETLFSLVARFMGKDR